MMRVTGVANRSVPAQQHQGHVVGAVLAGRERIDARHDAIRGGRQVALRLGLAHRFGHALQIEELLAMLRFGAT